jgi:hypothetical protein
MSVLFVSGVNDRSEIGVSVDAAGNLVRMLDGNCMIMPGLPLKKGKASSFLMFGAKVQQPDVRFDQRPSLIFNQIAAADTHRGALQRCADLCGQLAIPVINRPESVLETGRDRVSSRLQGIPGIRMPRSIRFNPASPQEVMDRAGAEGLGLPFLLRIAGDDARARIVRVEDPNDHAPLHALPLDGRDYFLTEYVECRDEQGHYHRQRLVVVDGKLMLREALFDRQWNVHRADRAYMLANETWDAYKERCDVIDAELLPGLQAAAAEIASRLQLDVFGLDGCPGPEGDWVVFDAGPNTNILAVAYPDLKDRLPPIGDAICDLLERRTGEKLTDR